MNQMKQVFQTCDILMLPSGNPAPKLEDEIVNSDAPRDPPLPSRPDTYNLANITGLPAIVLPCGFTGGPPTLPMGIQFYAKPFDEARLLCLSYAYESTTGWYKRKPPI
jgi:aspartyl-tRNA(Asn)/glutamyl-tRNA(Gln) amidotransferase subunit A